MDIAVRLFENEAKGSFSEAVLWRSVCSKIDYDLPKFDFGTTSRVGIGSYFLRKNDRFYHTHNIRQTKPY